MVLVTVLVLGLALLVGLAANQRMRPFAQSEVQGVKLELLVSPLLTLTALLLAFVLVQVFSGYTRARLSAGDEAGRVIGEFKLFGLLPDEYADPAQSALICYARAVSELEWPQLREKMKVADEPLQWAFQADDVMKELAEVRSAQPFGTIVATNRDRIDARRRRIMETRPAVPIEVTWLMLGVSAVAVLSITTFTLPNVARRVQIGALTLLTLVFAAVQIAIVDLDTKFHGPIRVEPVEMKLVAQLMTELRGDLVIPCDERGRPL